MHPLIVSEAIPQGVVVEGPTLYPMDTGSSEEFAGTYTYMGHYGVMDSGGLGIGGCGY